MLGGLHVKEPVGQRVVTSPTGGGNLNCRSVIVAREESVDTGFYFNTITKDRWISRPVGSGLAS